MHIRIISPSGVIDPSFIDGAATRLRAWGYIVSEGAHARDAWGRFAGTDEHRLADIVDAINDPEDCSESSIGCRRSPNPSSASVTSRRCIKPPA